MTENTLTKTAIIPIHNKIVSFKAIFLFKKY